MFSFKCYGAPGEQDVRICGCSSVPGEQDVAFSTAPAPLRSRMFSFLRCFSNAFLLDLCGWVGYAYLRARAPLGEQAVTIFTCSGTTGE